MENTYYATGRRKSAIARTYLTPGSGKVIINNRPIDDYFQVETAKMDLFQPLVLTNTMNTYDIKVRVVGGWYFRTGPVRFGTA